MYTLFGMGLFPNAHCHRCFPQNSFTVSHSFCISKAKTNTRTRGGDKNLLSNYSTNEDQLIMTPKYSTAPTALKKIESLVENFSLFFAVFLLSTAIHSVTDFILQKTAAAPSDIWQQMQRLDWTQEPLIDQRLQTKLLFNNQKTTKQQEGIVLLAFVQVTNVLTVLSQVPDSKE